jgi:Asp-tRNA(Asn)/Glu-tRNA(Gln) amidotransferase A subunit family amidase
VYNGGFYERKTRSLTDTADSDPKMPAALEVASRGPLFQQNGKLMGPLHGVVMAIKGQYDTFDMRTTSGGDVQYANDRPPEDATFVKRLRDHCGQGESGGVRGRRRGSSFGGTFCNPYHTESEPGCRASSSVAANLATCAIGEETVVSIRWPASVNSLVGLAPTEELVSRKGNDGRGAQHATGPICRNVRDAAKILDVIAGYDPKDPLTVFSAGRKPVRPYASFAGTWLDGVRIGVIREYMSKKLFSKADEESIDIVESAIADVRKLGATVVDPGPEGALFQGCIARYAPGLLNSALLRQYRNLFPAESPSRIHHFSS